MQIGVREEQVGRVNDMLHCNETAKYQLSTYNSKCTKAIWNVCIILEQGNNQKHARSSAQFSHTKDKSTIITSFIAKMYHFKPFLPILPSEH